MSAHEAVVPLSLVLHPAISARPRAPAVAPCTHLNSAVSRGRYSAASRRSSHESTAGFQPTSSAFTKMTPPRDTVAGEQCVMWLISSSRRMEEVRGMRSLEARVSILLSS